MGIFLNQSSTIEARDYLRSLIGEGDGSVFVVPVEKDRYGRTVAEVFVSPRPGTGYAEEEEQIIAYPVATAPY